ncbi:transglycosylase SLT domain-containing protein [Nocardia nova]|jgi:hypothetical protein|uniref:transglycosylase SLT domain-containing protein n=1 Tax=Nocardia nova TaxID=37330 RepID=UPI0007A46239|nr:transglycosylase SLT domain-containing protein [Nocardia nova]
MPQYDAGTAAIRVRPSFKNFVNDAKAELAAMGLDAGVRLKADTDEARADVEGFRATAAEDVTVNVDADTAAARADVDAFRAEQERNPLSLRAEVDKRSTGSARAQFGAIVGELEKAGTLNLKVAGVLGAGAAVADLLAIASAAGQASRAVALIPAVGFAGLAGIGSAAVGFKGIPDAFKEAAKQSANATDNAERQREAVTGVSEAQYRVSQAQQNAADSGRAYLRTEQDLSTAYRDASRSLRDMNDQLTDQKFATEDASIGVEEAAKRLQQVQFDPTADSTTRRRAQLTYDEAVQRLKEQQTKTQDLAQDTAEANAKGVEGSKQVVDAKDRVAAAAKAQASAEHEVVSATEGLAKAQAELTKTAGGGSGLADAMAKLSPNARELVTDIRGIGPAWTDARKAGQDALTAGLGADIQNLAGVQLPNARAGIVGINTAINGGLRASLAELSTTQARLDFKTTLDNTARGFAGASAAAGPFTEAMRTLVTVGSASLPGMGAGVDQLAIRFDKLIQRTAADGSLKAWIDSSATSLGELAHITGNVGSAFASILRAAGDGSQSLRSLDELTAHMAEFLKSAHGQQELGKFFAELRQDGANLVPLLQQLPGLLGGVMDGFRTWSAIATPFLQVAASLLAEHPQLVEAAVVAYLGFKTVKPIIDGASLAIDQLAAKAGGAAAEAGGVGKFKAAGQGLLNVLGSPWAIGLAAAGTAVLSFEDTARKGADAVQRFHSQAEAAVTSSQALQRALQSSGGKLNDSVIDAEAQSVRSLRDNLEANAKDIPGLQDKINAGAAGIANSLFGVGGGVLDNTELRDSIGQNSKAMQDAFNSLGLSNQQLAQKITGSKPDFDDMITRLRDMGDGGKDAATKLQTLRDEWALDATAAGQMSKAFEDLNDRGRDAAASIDEVTSAMKRGYDNTMSLEDANEKLNKTFGDMGSSAQQASGAIVAADGTIDTTTTSGQRLRDLLRGELKPAWDQVTAAAYADAIQHGQTADQAEAAARRASDATYQSALKSIEAMGYSAQQADSLLKHYEPLAGDFNANFHANTDEAVGAVDKLQKRLDDLLKTEGSIPGFLQLQVAPFGFDNKYHPQVPTQQGPQPSGPATPDKFLPLLTGNATGGKLPTRGPGTERRDGFLAVNASGAPVARVDGGEWVINRHSSAKYDRELSAINDGSFPHIRGYAEGGQLYPQAPLPGRLSDDEIRRIQNQAAVDAANSERNRIYADPAATPQDRRAADLKYQQAQNTLESGNKQDKSAISLQGIFGKAGGILATGLLSAFGLENSILSDNNVYNKDFNTVVDFYSGKGSGAAAGGTYAYTPQNLPSAAPTLTPPPSDTDPASGFKGSAPTGAYPSSPADTAGAGYNPSAGVEQWRPMAIRALEKEGFDTGQVDIMLAQIQSESGGNPSIVQQVHDVNSGGNEAVGILQVTPGTFAAYRDPALPNDRTDAYANMVAALRYYRARYGMDLSTMWGQGHGYARGGWAFGPGGSEADGFLAPLSNGEFVVNAAAAAANAPLLEAVNSSHWSPGRINPAAFAPSAPGSASSAGNDYSIHLHEPRVADVSDLMDVAERANQKRAIGLMAALP